MQTMKEALLRLVSSMKFWTLILGLLVSLGAKYGFEVDPEVYWAIVGLFGFLLGAQGLTDQGKTAAIEETKRQLHSPENNVYSVDLSKVKDQYKL
jgi:hypothetical protein